MTRSPVRLARVWVLLAAMCGATSLVAAQTAGTTQSPRARLAEPSRAESLLTTGRLAAAEAELYSASDAKPRDPAARGALAAYLASRGRFVIALVLFDEAQRFGADRGRVNLARAAILPYTTTESTGGETTVMLTPSRAPHSLGQVPVRTTRSGDEFPATIDPNVVGVVMGPSSAIRFDVTRGQPLRDIWIGTRRFTKLTVRVSDTIAPDELRIGLDVLWALHPLFDERAGTLTLGRAPRADAIAEHVPFVLTFPGLLLVPRVGEPGVRIESPAGRTMRRGTRWQIDQRNATLRVQR